jgi:hypothetical protein
MSALDNNERTQKVLPHPVGPAIRQVKGCDHVLQQTLEDNEISIPFTKHECSTMQNKKLVTL